MSFFRPVRSIRTKLAILIATSVGAAVLLAFAVSSYRELTRFGEAKRAELAATADVLATSVSASVANGDRVGARQALNAVGRIPGVLFAEIRDAGGRTFVQSGMSAALQSDDPEVITDSSAWHMLWQRSITVTSDVVKGGRKVGTLALLVDTSELSARLKQALVAALLGAAAAIAIGLVIAARMQRSVTRPLRDLTETMNKVRLTSDFSERAERRSHDETGQLVDAFNDMLDQISRRDQALEEHRTGLERTVEERTRDLVTARDAAESASRAKSEFLATMSHEIRTPMNGMLVMAELLAGSSLAARQQRYAETIARSGQTLLAIINDILDVSKIEAGKLELEKGRVSLAAIVGDTLGLFSERAASKGLDLAAQIGADVPETIEGDPVRLSQVVSNLVNNALKFTETGHVKLTVERKDDTLPDRADLMFTVEDTGIGIPADKVETIFEAFGQADQSTTRRFGGTGLGLTICQRLVAAMGGRIWAESEPGRGSRFIFTIRVPVIEPAAEIDERRGGVAIVAIDGTATRSVVTKALAERGYVVRHAVAAASAAKADIVFAGADWIAARGHASGADCTTICVAGVGNGKADRLIAEGRADALLLLPVSSASVREMLAAAEAGRLAELQGERNPVAGPALPSFHGLDVLVADDSPVNREVVSEALAQIGARAITVEDGAEAVAAYRDGRFDVVLMDCSMPEMDGFAASRAIRALEAETGRARTPIVALTAHVAGGTDSWQAAGMDDYLTKPFTMRSLADSLTRVANGERAPDAAPLPAPPSVPLPAPAPETVAVSAEAEAAARATASAAEDGPALDPAVLESLMSVVGNSEDMIARIFGLFVAHAPARLEALRRALAIGDLERVASEAHALKSPSFNIGALRLAAVCADIEARAQEGDPSLAESPAVDRLADMLDAVIAAIGEETRRGPDMAVAAHG